MCAPWLGTTLPLGEPSRWEGRREIGFFITKTSRKVPDVISLTLKVSDNKILLFGLGKVQLSDVCDPDVWREAVSTAWEQVGLSKAMPFVLVMAMLMFSLNGTCCNKAWLKLSCGPLSDLFPHHYELIQLEKRADLSVRSKEFRQSLTTGLLFGGSSLTEPKLCWLGP